MPPSLSAPSPVGRRSPWSAWWLAGLLLAGLNAQAAPPVKEKPIPGADVFIDQPDNLATRVKVQTNAKGQFQVTGLKPGMYRVVVQTTDLKPGDKPADPSRVGALGLRYASVWGQDRQSYGRYNYITVYLDGTAGSGGTSMNQKLVNGRTMGVFVTVYKTDEVVRGRVEGSP